MKIKNKRLFQASPFQTYVAKTSPSEHWILPSKSESRAAVRKTRRTAPGLGGTSRTCRTSRTSARTTQHPSALSSCSAGIGAWGFSPGFRTRETRKGSRRSAPTPGFAPAKRGREPARTPQRPSALPSLCVLRAYRGLGRQPQVSRQRNAGGSPRAGATRLRQLYRERAQ